MALLFNLVITLHLAVAVLVLVHRVVVIAVAGSSGGIGIEPQLPTTLHALTACVHAD